jgi:hypothetical protein
MRIVIEHVSLFVGYARPRDPFRIARGLRPRLLAARFPTSGLSRRLIGESPSQQTEHQHDGQRDKPLKIKSLENEDIPLGSIPQSLRASLPPRQSTIQ